MNTIAMVATSVALVGLSAGALRVAAALAVPLRLAPFGRGAVAMASGVGAFVTTTGLVARAAGSFDAGLVASAVLGVLLVLVVRPIRAWVRPSGEDCGTAVSMLPPSVRVAFFALLGIITVLYAFLSTSYQMHDEHAIFGHKTMIEELRRGVYPLYVPPIPGVEARYHFGFDLLAGALARAFMISSDVAIDVITVAMVAFMCWSAAALAVDNGAAPSAPFAAVAIHFGAGLASVMLAGAKDVHPRCLIQYHHPSCGVDLFPTQLLNVFQHPVALAVPLFLVFALLAPRLFDGSRAVGPAAALLVAILPAMALGQLVYYALASLALLASLPLWAWHKRGSACTTGPGAQPPRPSPGRPILVGVVGSLVVLGISLALARLLGGMFAPNETIEPNLVVRRPAFGFPAEASIWGVLWHHTANLGIGFLLLPLFAIAAGFDRRPAIMLLLAFAVGGILVAHLYEYRRSWDIVKFPSASSFALSMLYVLVVDRALAGRSFPWTWIKRSGRALLVATGVLAAAYLAFPLVPEVRPYDLGTFAVDPVIEKCIEWFRRRGYEDEEVIFAQSNVAQELAVFGGLSVVAEDSDLVYLGIRNELLREQSRLAQDLTRSMERFALDRLRVRWIVLSDEEIPNLGVEARMKLERGEIAEVVATFEGATPEKRRRIWRVKR